MISFNIFDNFKSVMVVYQDNCVHQSFLNVGDLSIRTNNCQYMGSTGSTTVLKGQTFLLLACGRHYVTSTQRTQTFTKRIGFINKARKQGFRKVNICIGWNKRKWFPRVSTMFFLFSPSGKSSYPPFFLSPQILIFKQADVIGNDWLTDFIRPYRPQMIQTVLELSGK